MNAEAQALLNYEKEKLGDSMVKYLSEQAEDYPVWNAERAIRETVRLLTSDIGAAQSFIYAIGLDLDLYGMEL